jgi:hypothetical protein
MKRDNFTNEIFVVGNEILKNFQDYIYNVLEANLKPLWGDNWFEQCIGESPTQSKSQKDLQGLLRQILFHNNGNFRLALAKGMFQSYKMTKVQLDLLSDIQIQRNFWAHPDEVNLNAEQLRNLASNILQFLGDNKTDLTDRCDFIIKANLKDDNLIPKILMNSNLFKKHIDSINEIFSNSDSKSFLESEIMQLRDRVSYLEALKKNGNGISSVDITPVYHFSVDMLANYIFLQIIYINVFLVMNYSLNSSSDKDIKSVVDRFNNGEELQNDISELMKQYTSVDEIRMEKMGTKNCKCEYCKTIGEKRTYGFLTPNSQKIFPFVLELQEANKGKVFYYD